MEKLQYSAINNLSDVDELEPLGEGDELCLEEIKNVLTKHQKLGRFGVTLLHKHFDLKGDEILVEFTDIKTRTQTIKPFSMSELEVDGNKFLETMWAFEEDSVGRVCRRKCVQYGGGSHHYNHVTS
jgi:hypothetical protein